MIRTRGIDRRILYWLIRQVYRQRTAGSDGQTPLKRVLLVRVDERVGNLIMMQSMLDALKRHLPEAEIGLWASVRMRRVTESLMGIDRLHELDKRWFFRRPVHWHRMVRSVRSAGYQVAIDASAWHAFSITHAVLTYFSGAPVTIGFRRKNRIPMVGRDRLTGFHTHLVEPGPDDEQEMRQHMRLLRPLGIQTDPPELRSILGQGLCDQWTNWLESFGCRGPKIGIWAGSRKIERRWALENYIQLGKRLSHDLSAGLLVLWGPGEESIRDWLIDNLPPGAVATPSTSLSELAGVLRCLDMLITNDTGPMHLSVAIKTPTVALFPSGLPKRWGHAYPFVENLAVTRGDHEEMDRVVNACKRLLSGSTK